MAATSLSQQLEATGHDVLVEHVLRSSAKQHALQNLVTREMMQKVMAEDVLPFIVAECQIEREMLLAAEQAEMAAKRTERRQADIPLGFPVTDAAVAAGVTTVPRGTVVYVCGSDVDIKAFMTAVCQNLLTTSVAPRTLYLRCQNNLHGNDAQVLKKAEGRLAFVPYATWRGQLESGTAWQRFTLDQARRLRDHTIDCVLIEDLSVFGIGVSRHRPVLGMLRAVSPFLVRWAVATQTVVVVGVPSDDIAASEPRFDGYMTTELLERPGLRSAAEHPSVIFRNVWCKQTAETEMPLYTRTPRAARDEAQAHEADFFDSGWHRAPTILY